MDILGLNHAQSYVLWLSDTEILSVFPVSFYHINFGDCLVYLD